MLLIHQIYILFVLQCWTDIKSGVKKQASAYKSFLNQKGGGSITDGPRQLNDFEEKVLSIITNDDVDGDASTPELERLEVLNELSLDGS